MSSHYLTNDGRVYWRIYASPGLSDVVYVVLCSRWRCYSDYLAVKNLFVDINDAVKLFSCIEFAFTHWLHYLLMWIAKMTCDNRSRRTTAAIFRTILVDVERWLCSFYSRWNRGRISSVRERVKTTCVENKSTWVSCNNENLVCAWDMSLHWGSLAVVSRLNPSDFVRYLEFPDAYVGGEITTERVDM